MLSKQESKAIMAMVKEHEQAAKKLRSLVGPAVKRAYKRRAVKKAAAAPKPQPKPKSIGEKLREKKLAGMDMKGE